MLEKINLKSLLKILILAFILFLVIVSIKYSGLLNLIIKVIKSLSPIFLACSISFINEPIVKYLKGKLNLKLAVFLIYFVELGLLVLIIFSFVPLLNDKFKNFFEDFENVVYSLQTSYNRLSSSFNLNLNDALEEILSRYSSIIIKTLKGGFNFLFNVAMGFVGAFFLSFDLDNLKVFVKKYLHDKNKKMTYKFFKEFLPFIHKYIYCLLIDMIFLWLISGFSFYLVGLDYPFVFAFIIAICDLIPLIGPFIGGAPAVILGLLTSFKFGLIILLIVVLAQFIESNITKPFLMKNSLKIHPIEGLLGISVLGSLLGFVGLIISPIIIIAIKLGVRIRKEK